MTKLGCRSCALWLFHSPQYNTCQNSWSHTEQKERLATLTSPSMATLVPHPLPKDETRGRDLTEITGSHGCSSDQNLGSVFTHCQYQGGRGDSYVHTQLRVQCVACLTCSGWQSNVSCQWSQTPSLGQTGHWTTHYRGCSLMPEISQQEMPENITRVH